MQLDRTHIILISLSALPLLIGSGFAFLVVESTVIGGVLITTQSYSVLDLIVQAIVTTALGILVVLSLFWVMNRQGKGAQKLVVTFVVSPILFFVSIFLGESFLLILFKGSTNVFSGLILIISLGVSMLSVVMILMDAIPPALKNLFVVFYGSIFGIFLGITMVTSTMIVLVTSLVIEDVLLTRYSPVAESAKISGAVGADPFDYTRIETQRVSVGVGDYVAYSLISAHTFIFFPFHVWIMSMLLAVTGVIINVTVIAKEDEILPAIPLPASLAIFPWIVHILAMALIFA
ncbi:MAG: hypothetical protein ACTSUO_10190 [Candidatus Thorarchaeota archaeon]